MSKNKSEIREEIFKSISRNKIEIINWIFFILYNVRV